MALNSKQNGSRPWPFLRGRAQLPPGSPAPAPEEQEAGLQGRPRPRAKEEGRWDAAAGLACAPLARQMVSEASPQMHFKEFSGLSFVLRVESNKSPGLQIQVPELLKFTSSLSQASNSGCPSSPQACAGFALRRTPLVIHPFAPSAQRKLVCHAGAGLGLMEPWSLLFSSLLCGTVPPALRRAPSFPGP